MSGRETSLIDQLVETIGEDSLIALCEAHGGTRLFVPADPAILAPLIGRQASAQFSRRFGGVTLRTPLARDRRARHYRALGLSNAAIARKLGLTETGVDKLFARMADPPVKGEDPRQLSLL